MILKQWIPTEIISSEALKTFRTGTGKRKKNKKQKKFQPPMITSPVIKDFLILTKSLYPWKKAYIVTSPELNPEVGINATL